MWVWVWVSKGVVPECGVKKSRVVIIPPISDYGYSKDINSIIHVWSKNSVVYKRHLLNFSILRENKFLVKRF